MTAIDSRRVRAVGALAAIVAAAALPFALSDSVVVGQLTIVLLDIVVVVGLNVAAGYAGMLVVGVGAIVGIGAYAAGSLNAVAGVPIVAAIVLGALIATACGMVLLTPALRLGRAAFAMVSLYTAYNFIDAARLPQLHSVTHADTSLSGISALFSLTSTGGDSFAQAQYGYWVALAVLVVVVLGCRRLTNSQWGRALIAVRDDDVSAAAQGVGPVRARVLALLVCALCAGIGGALMGPLSQSCVDTCSLSADQFSLNLSIFLFSALVVGGRGTVIGPLVGGLGVGIFYVLLAGSDTGTGVIDTLINGGIVYGILLVVTAAILPTGVWGLVRRVVLRDPAAPPRADAAPPSFEKLGGTDAVVLDATAVRVTFGGVVALDDVSLACDMGAVHALIGANGSGKTTLLNAISGVRVPDSGVMRFGTATLGSMNPQRRAALGIARTFQMPRIAADLSVLDNVVMGAFHRYDSVVGLYALPRRHARRDKELRGEAQQLLDAVGLGARATHRAGVLTHGERRLLEVARAMIARPRLLLLDEPAAGLASAELNELAAVILAARDAGCAVVLVEHNLAFVRRVASTATALDRGRVLAFGRVDMVLEKPDVISCFVGEAVA